MERRLQEADQGKEGSQADRLKRYERDRNVFTVRPGGNIFVQVIDPAASTGDVPGTVKVTLKTSSGDVLEGFETARDGAAQRNLPRGGAHQHPAAQGDGLRHRGRSGRQRSHQFRLRRPPGSAWPTARSPSGWKSIP